MIMGISQIVPTQAANKALSSASVRMVISSLGTRYRRWEVLYTSERWENWRINASRWEHLTDPEIETFAEKCLEYVETKGYREWGTLPDGSRGNVTVYVNPTAVAYNETTKKVSVWGWAKGPDIPESDILSNNFSEPTVVEYEFSWKRLPDRSVVFKNDYPERHNLSYHLDFGKERYFDEQGKPKKRYGRGEGRVIRCWPENIEKLAEFDLQMSEHKARVKPLSEKASKAYNQLLKDYCVKKEKEAYHEFIQEFGDPDLWEGHKKTLKDLPNYQGRNYHDPDLQFVIRRVVERGHEIAGLTVEEIYRLFMVEAFKPAASDPEKTDTFHSWNRQIHPKDVKLNHDYFDLKVEAE